MSYSPRERGLANAPSRSVTIAALVTYLVVFLLIAAFWIGLGIVVWHFIAKVW